MLDMPHGRNCDAQKTGRPGPKHAKPGAPDTYSFGL